MMKAKIWCGLLAMMMVGGCKEKKETREAAPVKVETVTVGTAALADGQGYPGTIEETSGTSLSFSSPGTVQRVSVSEGQFVRQGQLIGVLDATSARNAYDAALAAKEQALDAQSRMKQLHDAGSLPEIKWIEVQTQVRQALASEQIAKKGLADTKLYAPFSGYIAQKSVEAGANVAPGMQVVRLVRIDQVKVKISVPEEEISAIRQGQAIAASIEALGNKTFTGRVTEKGVSADPISRSYEVKAQIGNPGHELLPGMICDVTIEGVTKGAARQEATVSLPASVIQLSADNQTFVWTVVGGKARKTVVATGENLGNSVVITSGLRQGDKVIVSGQQKVSTGMNVTE